MLVAGIILALGGCGVSRNIVEVPPPRLPPLQELDRQITYTDPYAGRSDYIVPRR
jgi:hypothetical protein